MHRVVMETLRDEHRHREDRPDEGRRGGGRPARTVRRCAAVALVLMCLAPSGAAALPPAAASAAPSAGAAAPPKTAAQLAADKRAAQKLLAQGNQLLGEGDYVGALEKFRT